MSSTRGTARAQGQRHNAGACRRKAMDVRARVALQPYELDVKHRHCGPSASNRLELQSEEHVAEHVEPRKSAALKQTSGRVRVADRLAIGGDGVCPATGASDDVQQSISRSRSTHEADEPRPPPAGSRVERVRSDHAVAKPLDTPGDVELRRLDGLILLGSSHHGSPRACRDRAGL